jgi:hypothetical protein
MVSGVNAPSRTTATTEEQDAERETDEAAESTGEELGGTGEPRPDAEPVSEDLDGEIAAQAADADAGAGDEPTETLRRPGSGVLVGAAAVVSVGLGLASLTGTWLSDLMSSRQELIGQIDTGQAGAPSEQIAAIYGSPWHTTALFNGFFALAAVLVAGAALLVPTVGRNSVASPAWVRAVALGGLVLGVIGLLIAAVMWFDVFTEPPAVPAVPGA